MGLGAFLLGLVLLASIHEAKALKKGETEFTVEISRTPSLYVPNKYMVKCVAKGTYFDKVPEIRLVNHMQIKCPTPSSKSNPLKSVKASKIESIKLLVPPSYRATKSPDGRNFIIRYRDDALQLSTVGITTTSSIKHVDSVTVQTHAPQTGTTEFTVFIKAPHFFYTAETVPITCFAKGTYFDKLPVMRLDESYEIECPTPALKSREHVEASAIESIQLLLPPSYHPAQGGGYKYSIYRDDDVPPIELFNTVHIETKSGINYVPVTLGHMTAQMPKTGKTKFAVKFLKQGLSHWERPRYVPITCFAKGTYFDKLPVMRLDESYEIECPTPALKSREHVEASAIESIQLLLPPSYTATADGASPAYTITSDAGGPSFKLANTVQIETKSGTIKVPMGPMTADL